MEKTIINNLIKIGKNHNKAFNLLPSSPFIYRIAGNSEAYNQKKNIKEPIKVLHWFSDFWLFIEIEFRYDITKVKRKNELPNIFFSLSVFQGSWEDENKFQLFRAEWDNYEDSQSHAQPHWHIYTEYDKGKLDKSFEEEIKADEEGSFLDYIEGKREKVAMNRFHFAMNGQWAERNGEIHRVKDNINLINWFSGLILHIENELKYLSE